MPAAINEQTKTQVIHQWVGGNTREKIAIDNDIGEGTVSGIVNEWKRGLESSEYESVRELAVHSKKQVIALSDLASQLRLYNFIKKSGANEDQIESFISNCISGAGVEVLPPEKIVDLINQLFNISKSESIPLEQIPDYIQQKLQQKLILEEQIKSAEAVLQSKNVSIEAIDEHIHLNEELSKHGLSTKDTSKLVNAIKNVEQQGYDTKKIVSMVRSIKSLRDIERKLRSNCELLAKRIDRHKDTLPLAERIVAMRISTAGLLALEAAVNDMAEMYNLPVYTAAFRVINDIRDYNKLGGLKRQLAALRAQVHVVKEVCSHQNQSTVALVKLKSYGITEEDILNLNNYVERNMMNNKITNPEFFVADLEQHGSMKGTLVNLNKKTLEETSYT
jgi:hypothetical protein